MAPASVLQPAAAVLARRKADGLNGSMNFTYRNPDRSTDPSRSVAAARSLVAGALDYQRRDPPRPAGSVGRVARYAWRDHYEPLRRMLEVVAVELRSWGWLARVHADDNGLVDRNAAYAAGLGWYGKNANLLLPGLGSWFVLGAVVTDAPLEPTGLPLDDQCGSCSACFDGCPTDAIVAPGVVDARRCLAWLVQGPGPIPPVFREAVGDRLYGCDDCQDVCPPNRARDRRLPGPPPEADADPWVELEWVLTVDDEALLDRLGRWYIAERDPDVIRRTALVVLGNTADPDDPGTERLLSRFLTHARPLLRGHAVWAAKRLGRPEWLRPTADEQDPTVLAEIARPVSARSS